MVLDRTGDLVANKLDDYLKRHKLAKNISSSTLKLLTTENTQKFDHTSSYFMVKV